MNKLNQNQFAEKLRLEFHQLMYKRDSVEESLSELLNKCAEYTNQLIINCDLQNVKRTLDFFLKYKPLSDSNTQELINVHFLQALEMKKLAKLRANNKEMLYYYTIDDHKWGI